MPPNKPARSLHSNAPSSKSLTTGLTRSRLMISSKQGLWSFLGQRNSTAATADPDFANRHISGQQLCLGLREYAQAQWGMLARIVLPPGGTSPRRSISGRIVFDLD